jgi:hypothetical protein
MRSAIRAAMQPRYWHMLVCAAVGVGVWVATDMYYVSKLGNLPSLKEIWVIALTVPFFRGATVTLGAGGAAGWQRMIGSVACGLMIGVFSVVISAGFAAANPAGISEMAITGIWRAFVFTLLSVLGLLITEIGMPETHRIQKPPNTE